jgi:hypothetical protein
MYVVTCRRWFSVNQNRHSSTCFMFPACSLCKNKNKTNCNPIKLNLERPHPLFLTYQKQRGSIQDLVLIRLDGSTLYIKWKVWSCVTHLKISQLKCQNFRNISTISPYIKLKVSHVWLMVSIKKSRPSPVYSMKDGKSQVIVRFLSYRVREKVYNSKKELKRHPDKIFITENLTQYRTTET